MIYATLDQLRSFKAESQTICIKSTIPPLTIQNLEEFLGANSSIHLVYNPEFMREGSAIQDVLNNNPIVIGSNSLAASDKIKSIYTPLLDSNANLECIQTTPETAELIKYALNGLSSIRISYINEVSRLCTDFSADIDALIRSISWSEKLLPTSRLKPGCGYGGSCLPKDSLGLSNIFERFGFSSSLIQQAHRSNNQHINAIIDRTIQFIGSHQRVAILGVAFKSCTDDIRFAPSIPMIRSLLDHKCSIHIFDSHAMKALLNIFPEVHCYDSPYDAVKGSDCIITLTDCQQIQSMDLSGCVA
jgi:UDPglucose 6-dehydrogenase